MSKVLQILSAVGLIAVAGLVFALTTPIWFQAVRGPRNISEKELLALREPGWFDNYVRYKPALPAIETDVVYGKKGNEGTRFVLLPVGEKNLFCSARIADKGPEYVGRLGSFDATEKQATGMMKGGAADKKGTLLPFMMQSVRSIWFDTIAIFVIVLVCVGIAFGMVIKALFMSQRPSLKKPPPVYDD